jgi:hypothetical protein
MLNTLTVLAPRRLAALALAAAGACFMPGANEAQAGDRYGRDRAPVSIGFEFGGDPVRRGDDCEVRETRVWVEPVTRTVCDRVWVEAEYRTVCDNVWVAPVTRTVCEHVWIPDRYDCRTVVRRNRHGRLVRCEERVLVQRGHFDTVERVVEVCPGRWETVERRERVRAGGWQTVERQEVVVPGHWETRHERVRVAGRYGDHRSEDFRIGFEWRR